MQYMAKIVFSFGMIFLLFRMSSAGVSSLVNTSHLDYLYQEVTISGVPAAVIRIYSEAPDYRIVAAPGEGIACVDDAARAAIFYLRYYRAGGNRSNLHKARRLLNFIMAMQADNGYFYNFINADYQIQRTLANSRPVPDWWSWRALLALAEGYRFYRQADREYGARIQRHIQKLWSNLKNKGKFSPPKMKFDGNEQPSWLPHKSAADQASVLMLGLLSYYSQNKDSTIARRIRILARGIKLMQRGNASTFPFGAFLSWQNQWHAWGNSQSEALLVAGEALSNPRLTQAALLEIGYFYPYLIKFKYRNWFRLEHIETSYIPVKGSVFPQIAYGIRPMVAASLAAYRITGEKKYAEQAGEIASWLLGKNITGKPLYDPQTGRCFDGIESATQLNKNSGAESTIEALITLLAVEQNTIAKNIVFNFYEQFLKDNSKNGK